jgi:hypothetical protein
MNVREIAIKANIDKTIDRIKKAANKGAFSVDLNNVGLDSMSEDYQPITLLEEMHEAIQAEFSYDLVFEGNVVKWL